MDSKGYSDRRHRWFSCLYFENTIQVIRSREVVFSPEYSSKVLALFPKKDSGKYPAKDRYPVVVQEIDGNELLDYSRVLNSSQAPNVPAVSNTVLPKKQDVATELRNENFEEISKALKETTHRCLRDRSTLQRPERLREMCLAELDEPPDYKEAIESADHVHEKAAGRKTVANRRVFRVKRDAEGKTSRYKARLVAKGYSQRKDIEYNKTFSPVALFDTIRAILSVAAKENLKLAQFDVKAAFLNGILGIRAITKVLERSVQRVSDQV